MAYPDNIDYYAAVARGMPNHSVVHKFGRQTDLTNGAETPVWSRNISYTYLSAASYLILASDVDTDKTAGVGALTVNVEGLDTNYASISEDLTMAGFVGVTTTNQFLRIFRIRVNSTGSNDANDGRITAIPDATDNTFTAVGVPTATANVLAQVDSETSQTLMTQYTIPATCTGYITNFLISTGLANRTAQASMYVRSEGEGFQVKSTFALDNMAIESNPKIPFRVEPKSDIEWRAKSSTTAGQISIAYDIMLTDND